MSSPAVSGEVNNFTEVEEVPSLIPFDEKERQALGEALNLLQQTQIENQQREAIARNAVQATLWKLATDHEVDLKSYALNLEAGGFVKK